MNICVLDIKTSVGSIADFDEIMVPRNGTTLEYALKEMVDTDVGALSFENNYVAMEPSIYSSDFSGVSKPIFFERGGPRKVFNVSFYSNLLFSVHIQCISHRFVSSSLGSKLHRSI